MAVSSVTEGLAVHVLDLTSGGTSRELTEVEGRLNVVSGLLDALSRIDEVNKVIQFTPDRRSALAALKEEPFGYSHEQAEAVLGMPMSWQCAKTRERLEEERDGLIARRSCMREKIGDTLSLHWFG
jgi:DNA gyrase/topoisomerase IV subunit A